MQRHLLESKVGQVVVLDLINGKEVTTRIVELKTNTVVITKPVMFVPMQDPRNPNNLSVAPVPYGQPLHEVSGNIEIDLAHIFTMFIPSKDQIASYTQVTSGIQMAGAGAMENLGQFDPSKFKV